MKKNWIDHLVEISQAKYDLKTPLLLSNVQGELKRVGINLSEILLGRRLKAAIEAESNGAINIVRNPTLPLQWFVVPSVVTSGQLLEMIHKADAPSNQILPNQIPRFQSWFWAAFIKALPPKGRRFIVSGRFVETDATDSSALVPGYEVLESDIVSAPVGEAIDPQEVFSSIKSWLAKNNLDYHQYLEPDSASDGRVQGRTGRVLDISGLSDADLKRINLPLDIVLKIFG